MNSNSSLLNHLINSDALKSSNIIEAFSHIDRIDFVFDPTASDVYQDYHLQIGHEELLYKLPPLVEEIEPLELISLGYFERNDILYAKMQSTKFEILQASICSSFSSLNHQPFIPHVTLARIKNIYDKKVFKDMLNSYKNKTLGTLNARFELIRSHLEPQGAKYESIKKFES